ncbi:MAG TPA: four helix bundle protein [Bacteroidales bacterium]|nr:four helix bundle protein [Bacteroidales bacterium]HSA42808.1 four helix bundle protein [Bacteroidales bacterium]
MFDFERLELYQIAKEQTILLLGFLQSDSRIDDYLKDQWKRANFSIYLNLIEGTGRISENDKKHFLTIARGSVYESVAILNLVKDMNEIDEDRYNDLYQRYESISKMLLGMYRSYSKPKT